MTSLQSAAQRATARPARADRAIASIRDRMRVRRERLPDITRWLETKAAS